METVQGKQRAVASSQWDVVDLISTFAPLIFLITLIVIFGALEENFLKSVNLFNVMRQVSITGLIAVGMTFVILTAGIDLSVGSIVALAGLVAAAVAKGTRENTLSLSGSAAEGYGVEAAILAAIGVGLACGLLQGVMITQLNVPAFVVTLGGMSAFRGAALLFSNGGPISGFDERYRYLGQGRVDVLGEQIPIPIFIFFGFAILAHLTLKYTQYGRHVYAVGGNPEAARLSGLNVKLITASVYVMAGFFAGLAGYVLSARLNSSEAVAGSGYELTVIASVVIGGTSLFGGEGNIFGTVVGALLIGVLTNGLVLMNVSSYIQQIIIGGIIILAVAFDRFIKSKRRR